MRWHPKGYGGERRGAEQVKQDGWREQGGRASLQCSLYMPALVALRINPDLRRKYLALKEAGKPSKVAITAIMRKLIVLANALIRDNRKWSPNAT